MKLNKLFLTSLIGLATLTSCGEKPVDPTGDTTVTITDVVGRQITINTSKINRVICAGAGALRMYTYGGDLTKLVGVEDIDRGVEGANPFAQASRPYYDANKELFDSLPSIGIGGPANQKDYDTEKVIAAKPDLIISEFLTLDQSVIEQATGAKVVCVSTGSNNVFSDAVKLSLRNLSKIFNNDKGSTVAKYIEDSYADLSAKAKTEDPEKMYVGCLGRWGQQSILSTSPSYPGFQANNIQNIVQGSDLVEGKIPDLEYLVNKNPTKIILDSAGIGKFKAEYKATTDESYRNVVKQVEAFKNNEVYLQMPFNAYETNLEIALANAYYIGSLANPTAYADFDIAAKTDEITTKFLGKAMYNDIKSKPLSLGGYQKINNFLSWLEE